MFFIAPFGGVIADRVDRRRMLMWTQSLSMAQAILLAVLTLAHVVQVWEIIVLAFGLGFINAFDIPSRQAMTLDMVGREDLRHAIALNSMMFNLARVIGPSARRRADRDRGRGHVLRAQCVSPSAQCSPA